jgi:hypothetical protein
MVAFGTNLGEGGGLGLRKPNDGIVTPADY